MTDIGVGLKVFTSIRLDLIRSDVMDASKTLRDCSILSRMRGLTCYMCRARANSARRNQLIKARHVIPTSPPAIRKLN